VVISLWFSKGVFGSVLVGGPFSRIDSLSLEKWFSGLVSWSVFPSLVMSLWISEVVFASIFVGFPPVCIGSLVLEVSFLCFVSWVVFPWLVTVLVLGNRLRV
jgi:hypothetical protein